MTWDGACPGKADGRGSQFSRQAQFDAPQQLVEPDRLRRHDLSATAVSPLDIGAVTMITGTFFRWGWPDPSPGASLNGRREEQSRFPRGGWHPAALSRQFHELQSHKVADGMLPSHRFRSTRKSCMGP